MSEAEEETARAVHMVYEELLALGFEDATPRDAARLFATAMGSVIKHVTDPRELGGAIAGPGGPFDHGQNLIDARRAVLVDYQEVAKMDPEGARGQDAFAVMFGGRINRTADRATVLLLGDLDFLATTIAQFHGVAERSGRERELHEACEVQWRKMPHPDDV